MTLYEILGLTPASTVEEIRTRWIELRKRFHPDNFQTGNEEKFKTIKEAYEILSDPEMRAQYDLSFEPRQAPQQQAHQSIDWDAPEPAFEGPPISDVLGSIVDSIASTYVGGNPLLRAAYRGVRPKVKNELRRLFREEERVARPRRKAAAR